MSNAIATVKNSGGNGTEPHESSASRSHESAQQYTPRFDLWSGEHEWILYGDLPGVSAEDLDLHVEQGRLTVYGRVGMPSDARVCVAQEYGVGDFYRTFTIGDEIDVNNVTAEMKNGVLTVQLPKSESIKPRRIEIKAK